MVPTPHWEERQARAVWPWCVPPGLDGLQVPYVCDCGVTSSPGWRQPEGGDSASVRWSNEWINTVFCCPWGHRAGAPSLGRLGFLPRAHHPGKQMLLTKEGRYLPGYGGVIFFPSAGGLAVRYGGPVGPSSLGCLSSLCMLVFHHPQKESEGTASGPAHWVCGAGARGLHNITWPNT